MAERLTSPVDRYREYETIYILKQDVDGATAERIASRIKDVVDRESGKVTRLENWGRRRLAYDIAKQKRGVYTYVKFLGRGKLVTEVERNLQLIDEVIRYQTVVLREDVKVKDVEVDAAALEFAPLEPMGEDDKDDSKERLLGFIDPPEERRRRDDEDMDLDLNPDLNMEDDGE